MNILATAILLFVIGTAYASDYSTVRLEGDYTQTGKNLVVEVVLTNQDHRSVVGIDVICIADGKVVMNKLVIGILPKEKVALKQNTIFSGTIKNFDCNLTLGGKK